MIEDLIKRMEFLLTKKGVPYLYKSRFEYETEMRKKIAYIKKKEKIK